MKPLRNRVFCLAYGHHKMLFESEQAAMNFIKFNHDEILEVNGKAPTRAYYCDHCLGWHTTSKDSYDTESSYDMLGKKIDLYPEKRRLNTDIKRLYNLYAAGLSDVAFLRAIKKLQLYQISRRFDVELFRIDAVLLYIPLLSKCLEQKYKRAEEALNNKLFRTATEITKSVNKADIERIPELQKWALSDVSEKSPYENLPIASELFKVFYKCKVNGYFKEDVEICNIVYSHIIDIVAQYVTLIDNYIELQAYVPTELELNEFSSFFTKNFSKYEDDVMMAKIFRQTITLLRQRQDIISNSVK